MIQLVVERKGFTMSGGAADLLAHGITPEELDAALEDLVRRTERTAIDGLMCPRCGYVHGVDVPDHALRPLAKED